MTTQMEFTKKSVDFSKQSYPFGPQKHIPHGGSVPSNISGGGSKKCFGAVVGTGGVGCKTMISRDIGFWG